MVTLFIVEKSLLLADALGFVVAGPSISLD